MGSSSRDKEKGRRRSRSRSRSRDRRRSRSRDKYRRSSRSKSRERRSRSRSRDRSSRRSAFSGGDGGGSAVAQIQAEALAALQQQQLQRQLLAQQLLLQTQTLGGTALSSTKKQREVYIGNLTIGVVNDVMLRELFNGALASLVPDPVTNPPVVSVTMDPSGRYSFVEMRTEELATSAMQLDKLELCGRAINVGRPKGYVEPPSGMASQAKLGMAQMFAATLSGGVTNVVLLENLVTAGDVKEDQERRELQEEVMEECKKCGQLQGIAIPKPPAYVADTDPCRVYVKYATTDAASKCKKMMDGRMFDANQVKATHVTEVDFNRAQAGEWIQQLPGLPPGPLPGPPPMMPGMMPNMSGFH